MLKNLWEECKEESNTLVGSHEHMSVTCEAASGAGIRSQARLLTPARATHGMACMSRLQSPLHAHLLKLATLLQIDKILPIFKKAEVLPFRLPNFSKTRNFVFLTLTVTL